MEFADFEWEADERYYGIQTLRALENFYITGIPIAHYPQLIHSLAHIKKAAALANHDLGLLPRHIADVIARACDDIIAGKHHDRIFTVAAQHQILVGGIHAVDCKRETDLRVGQC